MADDEVVSTSQEQQGQEHQLDLPTSATTTTSTSFRVKVFRNTSGDQADWQDQGIGFCAYKTGHIDEKPDEIFVQNEKDGSPLLISHVLKQKEYLKLQETMIAWIEDTAYELILSFQEADGCDYIWNLIHERRNTATDNRLRTSTEQQQQQEHGMITVQAEAVGEMMDIDDRTPPMMNDWQQLYSLPMPELSNLDEITEILSTMKVLKKQYQLGTLILPENYIDKLVSVFESCEKRKSKKNLHKLYTIVKSMMLLNDRPILEQMARDENIMGVLGMLEYNPEIPVEKAYRTNLAKLPRFEPVVPIEDKGVVSKIQHSFRLKYFTSVIMGCISNKSLSWTLCSLMYYSYYYIIIYFERNHEYLEELFQIFKDEDSSDEMKKKASEFAIQLYDMGAGHVDTDRSALIRTLARHGLFDMFPFALCANDEVLRSRALRVLSSVVERDIYLLRVYTIKEKRTTDAENTTLGTVLKRFALADTDSGSRTEYAEIIKKLMDFGYDVVFSFKAPEILYPRGPANEPYLTVFFESYLDLFLLPFEQIDVKPIKLDGQVEELELTQDQSDICVKLCDLICLVIRQHSVRSKILMSSTDCFTKITQLYRCKESHVKCAALSVFRTCIGLNDEFYNQYLIELDVFEPTIRMLLDTDGSDNTLNSECLQMLEYIRRENIEILVEHLISNYGSVLDAISDVTICQMLRLRHEQNIEANEDQPNPALAESTSSNTTPPTESPRGGPLVNYNGSDSSIEEIGNEEGEEQITTTSSSSSSSSPSSSSPLVGYEHCPPSLPDSNKNSNNNNNNVANNKTNTTATIANIAEAAVTNSSSPSLPSPTSLGTTTAAGAEEQQAERAVSPPPPLSRRRKYEDDGEDDPLAARAEREIKKRKRTPPPTSLGAITTTTTAAAGAAGAGAEEQQAEHAMSPPPPLSRRRKHEDDGEDDPLAARAEREIKKRKRTPPPTSLGTATTTTTTTTSAGAAGAEEQQAERAVSPPPPYDASMRMMTRAMYRQQRLEEKKGETERTPRPLASSKTSPKKIILNPQTRKLRSNSK